MKFVATRTADQLDLQALHRVRDRLVGQRIGVINQIRAFLLERGIAVRQGLRSLRSELPGILATRTDVLSPRMLLIIEDLAEDWRRLDERIEGLSSEIETLARQDKACERLMTVPGIGPIISSAMEAGDVFSKGRDFGAWLGLVPKADLDGRPQDPRQNLEARQSLPARLCRRHGLCWSGQSTWNVMAQILDRSRQEAVAPQRAGDRARQQACPHRLGGSSQRARLRVRQDQ
jgi:transposase